MMKPEMSKVLEDKFLKDGFNMEDLEGVTTEDVRNMIALDIGEQWETLATFIGVSNVEVDDIKEKYREPKDRRLAMMRRWHQLWGENATYLKLIEGLQEIGRMDLILCVKRKMRKRSEWLKHALQWFESSRARSCTPKNILLVLLIILVFAIIYGPTLYRVPWFVPEGGNHDNVSSIDKNVGKNCTSHFIQRAVIDHELNINCSFPENDLPIIYPLFVGRENDVQQVLHRVSRAHIVNINGAPGFGKSTLAIHVGYEIFKNGSSVRYINIADKVFAILNQSKAKAMPGFGSNTNVHRAQTSSLIEGSKSSLFVLINQKLVSGRNEHLFEELQRWSETINCTTVLILDNCDDILVSTTRHKFLNLINTLVMRSHFKLYIIVVSCEKLFYVDSFDCWTIKELNQSASVEMLDELAPAIDNKSLTAVAELVEGCPLALKVVGGLLDIHGARLIPELKKELLYTLDKVSLTEQRFRVILDVAFNRLGDFRNCGYILSLFPGSFDKRAGEAIVQKECLDTYFKHSLLSEYSLAFNYRYKLHRIIKQYLQEKLSINEAIRFKVGFRKYFVSLLLTYAIQQEIDDAEKYTLFLELHNLYYLRELLLNEVHSSPEELAILTFLFDINLMQLEQLHRYYEYYVKMVHEVCPLLNEMLCGKMYTNVVEHLHQQCKCETLSAFFQNIISSPCMKYFQCEVVIYLQSLYASGILQLSDSASSYIKLLAGTYCNLNVTILSFEVNHKVLLNQLLLSLMTSLMIYFKSLFKCLIVIMIFCQLDFILQISSFSTHISIRVLAILLNCLWRYTIISACSIIIDSILNALFTTDLSLKKIIVSMCLLLVANYFYSVISDYQFIPMCI